jgi:hypothetical protein
MELFIPSTTSSENSEDRTYYLNSEINSDSTQYLIEAINRINRQDSITEAILKVDGIEQKRQPIKIYINTPGGSVTDGLALIGVISSSKTPVYTIANGSVCSMGIPILLSGHKRYSLKFTDVEVWNGRVTAKNRHHGQYTETYSCNCRTKTRRVSYTTTSGSGKNARTVTKYRTEQYQECDTCSRQWYTVKWNCSTTFGDINVAKVESLSTGVYNTPNPQAFEKIVVGDPASTTKNYTNYLQGSDFSILKNRGMTIPPEIKIPAYPTNVYDIYKINRFFTDLPFTQSELDQWNEMVANLNRDVGGPKQANIIIYVTKHGTNFIS